MHMVVAHMAQDDRYLVVGGEPLGPGRLTAWWFFLSYSDLGVSQAYSGGARLQLQVRV